MRMQRIERSDYWKLKLLKNECIHMVLTTTGSETHSDLLFGFVVPQPFVVIVLFSLDQFLHNFVDIVGFPLRHMCARPSHL